MTFSLHSPQMTVSMTVSSYLPCRAVFESGQRKVEVIGPVMEDEGAELHKDFW